MQLLKKILDLAIPRFLDEDVALVEINGNYEIVCHISDLRPLEKFDAVVTMRVFNLFGWALFPKQIGEVKLWDEYFGKSDVL